MDEDIVFGPGGEPVVPPGPMPEHEDHDGHTISLGAPSKVGPPLPKRPTSPDHLTPEQETRLRELAEKGPPSPRDVLLAAEARRGLPFLLAELDRLRAENAELDRLLRSAIASLRDERDLDHQLIRHRARCLLDALRDRLQQGDHIHPQVSTACGRLRDALGLNVTQPDGVTHPQVDSQEDDRG